MTSPYAGMTAVLYARVSTDDKDQTTESQIREMKTWCKQNDVEILEIYSEERSAADLERPEFDRVMGRIMRGKVNILLAWSESRITRNTADMEKILGNLSTYKTVLRFVTNDNTPETSSGELINYIGAWQAQEERAKLSMNTKNGMITAAAKGIHCGCPLALVFSHRMEENRYRIKLDGKKPTKIVSLDSVMANAGNGISVEKTAEMIGVSATSLKKGLEAEGVLDEYRKTFKAVKKESRKGVMSKRVDSSNIEGKKQGDL